MHSSLAIKSMKQRLESSPDAARIVSPVPLRASSFVSHDPALFLLMDLSSRLVHLEEHTATNDPADRHAMHVEHAIAPTFTAGAGFDPMEGALFEMDVIPHQGKVCTFTMIVTKTGASGSFAANVYSRGEREILAPLPFVRAGSRWHVAHSTVSSVNIHLRDPNAQVALPVD